MVYVCSIEGCSKPVKSRGFCSAHAERYRLHGDPLGRGPSPKRGTGRNSTVSINCDSCGMSFHPFFGRERTSRVCSSACNREWQRKRNAEALDFFARVEKADGCWLWEGARNSAGYGILILNGRKVRAHRLAYEMAKGAIPNGLEICHSCDTPACVNPDHLWAGTHAENCADMASKNRGTKTTVLYCGHHPRAKLTASAVLSIREDRRPARIIAAEYGVSKGLIDKIRRRETWQHVERYLSEISGPKSK